MKDFRASCDVARVKQKVTVTKINAVPGSNSHRFDESELLPVVPAADQTDKPATGRSFVRKPSRRPLPSAAGTARSLRVHIHLMTLAAKVRLFVAGLHT